jgi:hydroxymethylglutaryl-CoA lyase
MEAVTCLDTTNMAVHLHDTNNTALANMLECLKRGVRVVDASIGGLGGCPYAKKANGNVSTENVIYVLDALNIAHGVDREKIK